jgi:HK97 gp10 family phage protein
MALFINRPGGRSPSNVLAGSVGGKSTTQVLGLQATLDAFQKIAPQIQGRQGYPKNALRSAARAMAKVGLEYAKKNAPVSAEGSGAETSSKYTAYGHIGPGRLKDNLVIKLLSAKYRDMATAQGDSKEFYYIGARADKGTYHPEDAYYLRFIETGTDYMPAQPFLRRSVQQGETPMQTAFAAKLKLDVDKITKRLNAETKKAIQRAA